MIDFVLLITDPHQPQIHHCLRLSLRDKPEKYEPMTPSTSLCQKAKYQEEIGANRGNETGEF